MNIFRFYLWRFYDWNPHISYDLFIASAGDGGGDPGDGGGDGGGVAVDDVGDDADGDVGELITWV